MRKIGKIILACLALVLVGTGLLLQGCGSNENEEYVAKIARQEEEIQILKAKCAVSAVSNNEEYGTAYGSGSYVQGEIITLVAIPNEGYLFSHWEKNNEKISSKTAFRVVLPRENTATYTAVFKTATVYSYSLDKIELYAVANGTITAKNFEFNKLIIYLEEGSESKELAVCDVIGKYDSILTGAYMIQDSHIKASSEKPFVFYSMKNGEEFYSARLKFSLDYMCNSFVLNSNGSGTYSADAYTSHGSNAEYATYSISIGSISENYHPNLRIYTDSSHGYSIYARLSFVKASAIA
jgi:hypothetical protein